MPDPSDALEDAIIASATAARDAAVGQAPGAAAQYAAAAKDLAEARAWIKSSSNSH